MGQKQYKLTLTENQVKALKNACEQYARLICGQDTALISLFSDAWSRQVKNARGKNCASDLSDMILDAQEMSTAIRERFYGIESKTKQNGCGFDKTADILFDIYTVLRYRLWLDDTDPSKSTSGVDPSKPIQLGTEPLCRIEPYSNDE